MSLKVIVIVVTGLQVDYSHAFSAYCLKQITKNNNWASEANTTDNRNIGTV